MAGSGVDAAGNHDGSLGQNIDFNSWVSQSIQRAIDQIVSRLQGGLAVLGTVGSIAPFVGLFGTVWGIYHARPQSASPGRPRSTRSLGPWARR
ncbi:MAG TPA: MotA/TolQ/ExbB proton channel family protein [Rhodopila sp.]